MNENVWLWTLHIHVTTFVIIALNNGLRILSARVLVVKEVVSAQAVAWTLTPCFLPSFNSDPSFSLPSSHIWIFLSSSDHTDYLCEQPVTLRFGQQRSLLKHGHLTHPHPVLSHHKHTYARMHTRILLPSSCFLLMANKKLDSCWRTCLSAIYPLFSPFRWSQKSEM